MDKYLSGPQAAYYRNLETKKKLDRTIQEIKQQTDNLREQTSKLKQNREHVKLLNSSLLECDLKEREIEEELLDCKKTKKCKDLKTRLLPEINQECTQLENQIVELGGSLPFYRKSAKYNKRNNIIISGGGGSKQNKKSYLRRSSRRTTNPYATKNLSKYY